MSEDKKYKGAICRGSSHFGTSCGYCEKCQDEVVVKRDRMLTLGEIRVGFNFNPSESPIVKATKVTYASEIDRLESLRDLPGGEPASSERQRLISRAQTYAEDACMIAVKCLFA